MGFDRKFLLQYLFLKAQSYAPGAEIFLSQKAIIKTLAAAQAMAAAVKGDAGYHN